MVGRDETGGVPGVGRLAGPGLAGVAPVGVQGGAAEHVTGLPGAALRPVDGARPGVGEVRRTVFARALYEGHWQRRRLSAAVEADRQAVAINTGNGRGGAIDQR